LFLASLKINPDDYDLLTANAVSRKVLTEGQVLIIPGGSPEGAPTTVRTIKKAQAIAQSFFAKNKPVAAVCHGP